MYLGQSYFKLLFFPFPVFTLFKPFIKTTKEVKQAYKLRLTNFNFERKKSRWCLCNDKLVLKADSSELIYLDVSNSGLVKVRSKVMGFISK